MHDINTDDDIAFDDDRWEGLSYSLYGVDSLSTFNSGALRANPIIVCYAFMNRTPVEMVFAKASLARNLGAFRAWSGLFKAVLNLI